jgi:hypothetical protein
MQLVMARNCADWPDAVATACDTAFEGSHSLLEDIRRGIHQTGVDIPEFLEPKQVGSVFCVVENVRTGLINGHCPGVGRTIRRLAGVELKGLKTLGHQTRSIKL